MTASTYADSADVLFVDLNSKINATIDKFALVSVSSYHEETKQWCKTSKENAGKSTNLFLTPTI